jgi:hypothetical protein
LNQKRIYLEAGFAAALAVWLGVIIMTGVAAARTFPILRDLKPTLAEYPAYTGDHWLLAAGKVANSVFFFSNLAQLLCFLATVATLVLLTVQKQLTFVVAAARWACVAVLTCVLTYYLLVLGTRMNANLTQYWEAAAAGDTTRAEVFQAAFSADHPRSSAALGALAVLLLIALVVNGWTMVVSGKALQQAAPKPASPPPSGRAAEVPV